MSRAAKLFGFFTISVFTLGSAIYLVLHAVMPHGHVFGSLYRMFQYHEQHPFQYITVVAVTYAMLATACVIRWPQLNGWRQHMTIAIIILATILIASVPGGILWKIHDMQAGFFTKGERFWNDLWWGATTGLQAGWQVVALSLPYNLIGLLVGYFVTLKGFKISARENQVKSASETLSTLA